MNKIAIFCTLLVSTVGCTPTPKQYDNFLNVTVGPKIAKCLGDDYALLDIEKRRARYLKCKGYGSK
jgi:hypothetical protein